jgi:hypothetical protein
MNSGSDICTCRPYLIYGIEEAVKCAQRGGVGLIVYFRKEGRALGEVTKCMSLYLLPRTHIPTLPYLCLLALSFAASHYLLPLYSLRVENPPSTALTALTPLYHPPPTALAPLEHR